MRTIEITTDVFATIWRLRLPGENNENAILSRVLGDTEQQDSQDENITVTTIGGHKGKVRWVDDVMEALRRLGGTANLAEIYRATRAVRSSAGRSIPKTVEATIRRTLEDHSSDSANFRGKDLFKLVSRGRWAIR